jgi:hypothetical protein
MTQRPKRPSQASISVFDDHELMPALDGNAGRTLVFPGILTPPAD